MLNNKIMRVLPTVSVGEWIGDEIRFFVKLATLKMPLAKISSVLTYLLEELKISLNYRGYERINLDLAINTITKEINKKKGITLVLNDMIDTRTTSLLRKYDKLKKYYNINITTTQIQNTIINSYENFYKNNNMLNTPKNNLKIKSKFLEKLINYANNLNTDHLCFNFNLNTLINILEGRLYFTNINKFIINAAYNRLIPHLYNKFIIDQSNQGLVVNTLSKSKFITKAAGNLYFGNDIITNKIFKEKSLNISNFPSNMDLIIPEGLLINNQNTYINIFGEIKKAQPFYKEKNIKGLNVVLGLLYYKLNKKRLPEKKHKKLKIKIKANEKPINQ